MSYGGWEKCIRMQNGKHWIIYTQDSVHVSFEPFHLKTKLIKEFLIIRQDWWSGMDIMLGHRLWHAPESKPRTYFPIITRRGMPGIKILSFNHWDWNTSEIQKKLILQFRRIKIEVKVTIS
jgi:hypothetical protein